MARSAEDRPEKAEPATNVEDLEHRPAPPGTRSRAQTFTLIRRLADEVTTLFTKELALLRVEMLSALRDMRVGIGTLAVGGAVAFAGFMYLLLAGIFALTLVWPAWAAALTVGGAATIVGLIMLAAGRSRLEASNLQPERTRESLRKDRNAIERNIHEPH